MADLQGIITKASSYLNDVVNLRIITAVGEFSATYDSDKKSWTVTAGAGNNSAILTNIDLIQGDIINLVPQAFAGDGSNAVRDFHSAQVDKAESIVRANIAALKGMIEVLVSAERTTQPATAVRAVGGPGAGPGPVGGMPPAGDQG